MKKKGLYCTGLALVFSLVAYVSTEAYVRFTVIKKGFSYIQVHPDKFPYFSLLENYHKDGITIKHSRRESEARKNRPFNVAFVGDSQTFGIKTTDPKLFTEIIQREQNQFNAYNFGVPGYGLPEVNAVVNKLTKTDQYKIIVYLFNLNDIFPTMAGTLPLLQKPEHRFAMLEQYQGSYGRVKLFIKDHLKALIAVPYLMKAGFYSLFPTDNPPSKKETLGCYEKLARLTHTNKYKKFYQTMDNMYADPGLQKKLSSWLEKMKTHIENSGGRLVLFIHHGMYFFENDELSIRNNLVSLLKRSNIEHRDLYPAYVPYYKKCDFFYDTTHLGPVGHRHLANSILSTL